MKTNKLRIKLRAYDYNILDASFKKLYKQLKTQVHVLLVQFLFLQKSIVIQYFVHLTSIKNHVSSSKCALTRD
jgi:hypothetical protein